MSELSVVACAASVVVAMVPAWIRNDFAVGLLGKTVATLGKDNLTPRATTTSTLQEAGFGSFNDRAAGAHQNLLEHLPELFGALALSKLFGVAPLVADACVATNLVVSIGFLAAYLTEPATWKGSARSGLFTLRLLSNFFLLGASCAAARGRPGSLVEPVAFCVAYIACYGIVAAVVTPAGAAARAASKATKKS